MTSAPLRGLGVAVVVLALGLVSCSDVTSSPTSSLDQSATPSPDPSQAIVPVPGRPYDGAALLEAMRASTRPGGVPDELETDAVAAAVAAALWTWDGRPWDTLAVGGACGASACDLEVSGQTDGMAGADLYSFTVDPASGEVTQEAADLHGYPAALDAPLDEMARASAGDEIGDLTFVSARWLPPLHEGRYWLAYRTGGEEGAPGIDLLLDAATGQIVERREV